MIFVDTSAWFASVIRGDKDHAAITAWLEQNTKPLFTTDYIIDETLTLLKARGQLDCALELGKAFFDGDLAVVHYLSEAELRASWNVFQQFKDKGWSFTDCSSKYLIDKMKLEFALSFDRHFPQFGAVRILP